MKAPTTLAKLLLIAVVTGAATTGCATGSTLSSRGVVDRPTTVRIRNNNWNTVKVYLIRANGGPPVRLGTVSSMTTERIPVRGAVASELHSQGSLRFLIRPLGDLREGYTTHEVFMTPGDVMQLTVENQLRLSQLVVGSR